MMKLGLGSFLLAAALGASQASAQRQAWYSFGENRDRCVISGSPADFLTDLRQDGYRAWIEDDGLAAPQRVVVRKGVLRSGDTVFWRSQEACERELPRNQAISDRYR